MTKPSRSFPRPLSELLGATLNDVMKAQGFASTEIISRWADIVGLEIAAHSEPLKISWPRAVGDEAPEPATLVLRVEGPAALEIQHLSAVIISGSIGSSVGRRSVALLYAGPPATPRAVTQAGARSSHGGAHRRNPARRER